MSGRLMIAATLALAAATALSCSPARSRRAIAPALRVCADPNNLPFSNSRLEGFENRIATMLAADLGARVEYTWWAARRGFLRNTLNARKCDVVIGLPTSMEMALVTQPYYRSSYVFVTRHDSGLHIRSFDDPQLKRLRIGVPMVSDDGANAPPAHALARRGLVANLVQYSVYGDYRQDTPPAALVKAVADRSIDVAAAWGPLAGYFASRQATPLDLTPVEPQVDTPFLPFVFDISMAVRRDDRTRRDAIDAFLTRNHRRIDAVLAEFGVPRLDAAHREAAP